MRKITEERDAPQRPQDCHSRQKILPRAAENQTQMKNAIIVTRRVIWQRIAGPKKKAAKERVQRDRDLEKIVINQIKHQK